jgi:hypothetical protein
MNINIDKLREIIGVINRRPGISSEEAQILIELYTPPMKGSKLQPREYHYPEALLGTHQHAEEP